MLPGPSFGAHHILLCGLLGTAFASVSLTRLTNTWLQNLFHLQPSAQPVGILGLTDHTPPNVAWDGVCVIWDVSILSAGTQPLRLCLLLSHLLAVLGSALLGYLLKHCLSQQSMTWGEWHMAGERQFRTGLEIRGRVVTRWALGSLAQDERQCRCLPEPGLLLLSWWLPAPRSTGNPCRRGCRGVQGKGCEWN